MDSMGRYQEKTDICDAYCLHSKRERVSKCRTEYCNYQNLPCWTPRETVPFFILIASILILFSPMAYSDTYEDLEGKAVIYLGKFGYLGGPTRETGNLMLHEDLTNAIKKLQRMGNIPETGVIDPRTKELMERPRCGMMDFLDNADRRRRRRRYTLAPTKWEKTKLTYNIVNYTPDLPMQKTRLALTDAFKVWSGVTKLSFTEVRTRNADILIQFERRYHQDGYPFDGNGMILAHAFFPGDDKGGDTHFDDDENWTFNSTEGVDLFMVAAHEFGHALGLGHSTVPGSLMYPWYQGYQPNFKLPRDDVEGIQRLYGSPQDGDFPQVTDVVTQRPNNRIPYTVLPPRPDDIPNPCEQSIDAITVIRTEVFLFIKKWFWRLDSRGIPGDPLEIHSFWYGFPKSLNSIDAVFERTDGRIVFFKGDKYWIFNGNNLITGHPQSGRPITDFGIPMDVKKIDAVFVWGFNKRTYIISRDMYWKLNEENNFIEYDYPRDMGIWRRVPVPVDAAFQFWNKKTYFLKGKQYWEFYDNKMRVQKGYPKNFGDHWLGCKGGNLMKSNDDGTVDIDEPRRSPFLEEEVTEVKDEAQVGQDGGTSNHQTHNNQSSRMISNMQSVLVAVFVTLLLFH